jgi:hypothetical protein
MPVSCTPDIAGATTETTNGVTGSVCNSDNTPAANSIVKLFAIDYDPVAEDTSSVIFTDTTDDDGLFRFEEIAPGRYTVLVRSNDASASCIVNDIDVFEDSMTALSDEFLNKPGSIIAKFTGNVPFDSGTYIYLPGTDIFSFVAGSGEADLGSVPAGAFSTVILSTADGKKRNILDTAVTLEPEDTVSLINPLWTYHRKIVLNTSSTGADIGGDVYNFPILIRLDSNFDFTHTLPEGGDLLFTDSGNTSLPFEIEHWDADGQSAAIWVLMNTVFGNNSTQSITMYWGNSDAASAANSKAVFDTAAGFQGVWHLADSEGDSIADATVNHYNGGSPDIAQPQVADGIIGNCRIFDGADDFITMPNTADGKLDFEENGSYTVSAWVLLDTFDNASHCIVSKGYEQYYLRSTYVSTDVIPTATPLWEFVEFAENGDKGNWRTSTSPVDGKQWTLLVGVREGKKQLLYSNGTLVSDSFDIWENSVSRNTDNDLYIGRFSEVVTLPPLGPIVQGYNHFKGGIDEVRIINKAQNPDWVRLCYMNQRPDDRLVTFE